ncbi:preprotein translocase subunit YajC [uncultured Microbacterium sp.]|uniref:preprotein translocase subunit YajC n=1 Tax=uncultured Microbacterium sp. TaxID=191216 RepID=UPI00262461E2|nr:preprotein translocase subunit YajC [uncultured Microbacterium sp.]
MPMEFVLFGLLAVLLVFMFVNTRKRQKQLKAEQEEKATKSVPGAKVLLQGGIYGTIVEYDAENLDRPAHIEIAPGTVIEVHSQAILRIVEDEAVSDDVEVDSADESESTSLSDMPEVIVETPEETQARLERNADDK